MFVHSTNFLVVYYFLYKIRSILLQTPGRLIYKIKKNILISLLIFIKCMLCATSSNFQYSNIMNGDQILMMEDLYGKF